MPIARRRASPVSGVLLAAVAALALAGCGDGLAKQYEYEEDIYLSVDGSATIYVNASVPALINLRGLKLNPSPAARLDRVAVRKLYTTPVTRVLRVSTWRRFGRHFVQVRLAVSDIRKLASAPPFAWSTYQLDQRDDLLIYRQVLGAPAGTPVGNVGWTGRELVAFRLHLPSKIRYHNALPENFKRGNILVWEQTLAERQAGTPLEMEARMEQTSILYRTLWLFTVSGLLAFGVLAAIIWWVVRRGGAPPAGASSARGILLREPHAHMNNILRLVTALGFVSLASFASAQTARPAPASALDLLHQRLDKQAELVLPKVVTWRRDFHQHPELGNREVRTAKIVADHLRALGYEVRTGVARTGVVGVLRGGKPGPVVALRSDMDALPVTEELDLPFKSTVKAEYNGREVGVMHACGHDFHMSMLMGAAEVLASMRADLPGTVTIIFQPAEEGAPAGEDGGAEVMVKEGALDNPKVDAIFGLHVGITSLESGSISFRPAGIMAASDSFTITVRGRQTHGAMPWAGIDPIVVSSQIVMGLQTIISRQSDLTTAPAVVTIGTIDGGNRFNIVPDQVRMSGTIRTFDPAMQKLIHERIKRTAEQIAASAGASAEVAIEIGNPVTWNDPALTARMTPSLKRVATGVFNPNAQVTTTAEDFSFYQKKVPGLFFFLGVAPAGSDPAAWAANHSPRFSPDESALLTGVRALASVAVDYLAGK